MLCRVAMMVLIGRCHVRQVTVNGIKEYQVVGADVANEKTIGGTGAGFNNAHANCPTWTTNCSTIGCTSWKLYRATSKRNPYFFEWIKCRRTKHHLHKLNQVLLITANLQPASSSECTKFRMRHQRSLLQAVAHLRREKVQDNEKALWNIQRAFLLLKLRPISVKNINIGWNVDAFFLIKLLKLSFCRFWRTSLIEW